MERKTTKCAHCRDMDLTYVWAMRHRRISQYVNFRGILAGNLRSSVGRIVHEFQAEMSPTDLRGKQRALLLMYSQLV